MYLQNHYTPLYAASAEGFSDVVKYLMAANADVNCACKVCKSLSVYVNLSKIICCLSLAVGIVSKIFALKTTFQYQNPKTNNNSTETVLTN